MIDRLARLLHGRGVCLFWFRRDLRLQDNHGLSMALQQGRPVLPIFIFDPNILDRLNDRADRRVTFIYQTLSAMHETLAGYGGGLCTFHDTPERVYQMLIEKFRVEAVYTNHDYEPYAQQRDARVADVLAAAGVPFHTHKDQCVFERREVLTGAGNPYTVFTPYKRKWLAGLEAYHLANYPVAEHAAHFVKMEEPPALLSLEQIGFKRADVQVPPIELDEDVIRAYQHNRDFPARPGTSKLAVHLRFGTVSTRGLVRRARGLNETWLNELIWREFFMQILYNFPQVVTQSFRPEYDRIQWQDAPEHFAAWCEGNTGYPIVDAGMRELNETGFMHNRVRMIVASFLCKHLLIDWRRGERYFAEKLLDFDLSANNGNWQWAAGTGCDAAPYFRVFNPWTQTKKFDPEMTYIKRWVPEYLSADYPRPIVDHQFARERALMVYKRGLKPEEFEGGKPDAPGLFDA